MESIDNRLARIEGDILEIKNSLRRNDVHISFITRLYLMLRQPIMKVMSSFGLTEPLKVCD